MMIVSLVCIHTSFREWTLEADHRYSALSELIHAKNNLQKLIRTKLSQILPRFVNKKGLENSGDLRYNES